MTLRVLSQHKLNIKLRASVMLLCSTRRPRVWQLQRHRLHCQSHQAMIHHSMHRMCRIFRQCPIILPHSTVTDRRWRRATRQPLSHKHQLTKQQMQCRATTCRPRMRDRHPDTRRVKARYPSSSSLEPSSVTAQVCRSYQKRIVDLCQDPIDYVLLFPYGTDGFHLNNPKNSKAKSDTAIEYYSWRPMQRDGQA